MERNYKSLQELTILDGFMFGAVMTDKSICQELLERILGFPIGHLEIIPEKDLSYHPEYKGIRLDIYAKDGKVGVRYCENCVNEILRIDECL